MLAQYPCSETTPAESHALQSRCKAWKGEGGEGAYCLRARERERPHFIVDLQVGGVRAGPECRGAASWVVY